MRIAKWSHTTNKGIQLHCKVTYSLGGYNQFTSKTEPRGYFLHVQRSANEFIAFQGLDHPRGATRLFVKEVSRRSERANNEAIDLAMDQLDIIIENYNL